MPITFEIVIDECAEE